MARITITLREDERAALVALAASELRDPRDQARHVLREELESRGLLVATKSTSEPVSATESQGKRP